jgi:hypothetical protein
VSMSSIISCVGSPDPLLREYVHDFGLAAIDLTFLEESLRHHMELLAVLRAKWPMKVKKYRAIKAKYAKMTLGGLVPEFKKLGGRPDLVENLEPLVEPRNFILHNRIPLYDPEVGRIPARRIHELRAIFHMFIRDIHDRGGAIQKADHELYKALVDRIDNETPRSSDRGTLYGMLASFGIMVEDNPDA